MWVWDACPPIDPRKCSPFNLKMRYFSGSWGESVPVMFGNDKASMGLEASEWGSPGYRLSLPWGGKSVPVAERHRSWELSACLSYPPKNIHCERDGGRLNTGFFLKLWPASHIWVKYTSPTYSYSSLSPSPFPLFLDPPLPISLLWFFSLLQIWSVSTWRLMRGRMGLEWGGRSRLRGVSVDGEWAAAVTNYHKLASLKQQKFILSQFRRPTVWSWFS